MARARMISRSLGTSRRFNALYTEAQDIAEFAQLIFTLLIPHVDDYGRMAGDPQTVKLAVLPGSARTLDDFTRALEALARVHLVQVYRCKTDDIWLEVNKFEEHQRGLSKRTDSRIPAPKQGVPVNFTEIREIIPSRARAELRTKNLELRTENLELKEQNKLISNAIAAKGGVGGNGKNGRIDHKHSVKQAMAAFYKKSAEQRGVDLNPELTKAARAVAEQEETERLLKKRKPFR